ncbi:MAG: LytR C-terminal domain-containing protein [Actinobacteria bacterium]|nr:LytR C-terminal domain-containing protein [Actinomycetota bacterium]
MGRHSSDAQFRFYRSVIGWFLPWALVAAVAATALWIAVDALVPNELDARSPAGAVATSSPSPTPAKKASPSPTPSPSPSPTATGGGKGDGKKDDDKSGGKQSKKNKGGNGDNQPGGGQPAEPAPLITDGITVQVLNGTADAAADDLMANRLAQLGFDVIAIDASTSYAETTVFWSYAEAEPAAQALGARFGWHVAPKPDNLSSQVALHVVVGDDET